MMINEYSGEAKDYLSAVAELFQKLLARGVEAMEQLPSSTEIDEETNAIVLLYRSAMAQLDAVVELSGLPSVEAIKVVFRSFFETKWKW